MQTNDAIRSQRRYQRKREGLAVFGIEADEVLLAGQLVEGGFLRAHQADDRAEIAKALQAAVTVMLERGIR